jgi:NADH kinase
MSTKNRGRELDLNIDGKRCIGVLPGSEIRVEGEFVGRAGPGEEWHGGVPCVIRTEDDDPWVGGLNGLLKFNHPFGREPPSDEFAD